MSYQAPATIQVSPSITPETAQEALELLESIEDCTDVLETLEAEMGIDREVILALCASEGTGSAQWGDVRYFLHQLTLVNLGNNEAYEDDF